jgi:hypothetical protein
MTPGEAVFETCHREPCVEGILKGSRLLGRRQSDGQSAIKLRNSGTQELRNSDLKTFLKLRQQILRFSAPQF